MAWLRSSDAHGITNLKEQMMTEVTADPALEDLTMAIFKAVNWAPTTPPGVRALAKSLLEDGYSKPAMTVIELGEEGEMWMVKGTDSGTHASVVTTAVGKWVLDCCGVEDDFTTTTIGMLKQAGLTYRADWVWVPLNSDHPDDECELKRGDYAPANLPRFSGTLVSL